MTLVVASTANARGKTFLQLVQRTCSECSASGAAPVSTANQVREIARIVDWVQAAWVEIQGLRSDWLFMRQAVTFPVSTEAGISYTPAQIGVPLLADYKRDSFRIYSVAQGLSNEQVLPHLPYDQFRNLYLFGSNRLQQSRPVLFTVDPQKNFLLGPCPNEAYIVDGEVFAQPSEFVNDTDYPSMPSQFHLAIVYKAMMHYGQHENAPEVYQHGELEYNRLKARLIIDQTPKIGFSGTLA